MKRASRIERHSIKPQQVAELLIGSPLTEDVLVAGKECILFLERKNAVDSLFSICARGKRKLAEEAVLALERMAMKNGSEDALQNKALMALRSTMSAGSPKIRTKATAAVVRLMPNNRLDSAAEEIRKAVAKLK